MHCFYANRLKIGQGGWVRTSTIFSVPSRVACHMALTLKLDTPTGFEPAFYRFAGGSIAFLPRRDLVGLAGLAPANRRFTGVGLDDFGFSPL
jgi:hypothetical protein